MQHNHISKETAIDTYEHELKSFLDEGVFTSDPQCKEKKSWLVEVAKKKDLIRLKTKAAQNNIPYQTLISLLIHNYIEGKTTNLIRYRR